MGGTPGPPHGLLTLLTRAEPMAVHHTPPLKTGGFRNPFSGLWLPCCHARSYRAGAAAYRTDGVLQMSALRGLQNRAFHRGLDLLDTVRTFEGV